MATRIEHSGIVERIEAHRVTVRITAHSACGSCAARQACGVAESEEKRVEVVTDEANAYRVGDTVTVGVRRRIGAVAVMLAYVGALVVMLAALLVGILGLKLNEGLAALVALAAVGGYYAVLWLLRKKIEHTIKFSITKH